MSEAEERIIGWLLLKLLYDDGLQENLKENETRRISLSHTAAACLESNEDPSNNYNPSRSQ